MIRYCILLTIAKLFSTSKISASPSLNATLRPDGKLFTHPDDVDSTLRSSWKPVYDGNSSNHINTTIAYLTKYGQFLVRAPSFKVEPLSGSDLFDTVNVADHKAPGFDHWTYAGFSIYPVVAFDPVARLLNMIEDGLSWPLYTLPSKAHALSKNPDAPYDCMEYRFLLITVVL